MADIINDLEIVKRRIERLNGFGEEAEVIGNVISLLKAQEPGWISVENKTPEMFYRFDLRLDLHYYVSEIVLVTDGENYGVARYTKDEIDDDPIWDIASIYEMTPTHWMPLPEPPKEG